MQKHHTAGWPLTGLAGIVFALCGSMASGQDAGGAAQFKMVLEIRGARADTTDPYNPAQTNAYPGAIVRITGPVSRQAQPAATGGRAQVVFEGLPAGSFTVHIDPRAGDAQHTSTETFLTLAGIPNPQESAEPIVVVLPWAGAGSAQTPGETGRAADAVQQNNAVSAADAQQLRDSMNHQISSCDFPAAAASARRLVQMNPADGAATLVDQFEQIAAVQTSVNRGLALLNSGSDTGAREILLAIRQGQGEAPACLRPQVDSTIAALEKRVAVNDTVTRIAAAVNACSYAQALTAATELQTLDPNNDWLRNYYAVLQEAAAEQSAASALLQQAKRAQGSEAVQLAARLRDSAAPSCMSAEIQTTIVELEKTAKPSFLVSTFSAASQNSADKSLESARKQLQGIITAEAKVQTAALDRERAAEEQQRQLEAGRARQQQLLTQQAALQQNDEEARKKKEASVKKQQTFNALALSLGGFLNAKGGAQTAALTRTLSGAQGAQGGLLPGILNAFAAGAAGAAVPAPAGLAPNRGGAQPASDPFSGSWQCRSTVTASRKLPTDGSVQSDSREQISRNGNGWRLTDSGGAVLQSTKANGNSIQFAAASDTGSVTMDLQAAGNRLTGTMRGNTSDDAYSASLQCTR